MNKNVLIGLGAVAAYLLYKKSGGALHGLGFDLTTVDVENDPDFIDTTDGTQDIPESVDIPGMPWSGGYVQPTQTYQYQPPTYYPQPYPVSQPYPYPVMQPQRPMYYQPQYPTQQPTYYQPSPAGTAQTLVPPALKTSEFLNWLVNNGYVTVAKCPAAALNLNKCRFEPSLAYPYATARRTYKNGRWTAAQAIKNLKYLIPVAQQQVGQQVGTPIPADGQVIARVA